VKYTLIYGAVESALHRERGFAPWILLTDLKPAELEIFQNDALVDLAGLSFLETVEGMPAISTTRLATTRAEAS
jgi:hypothetical protein